MTMFKVLPLRDDIDSLYQEKKKQKDNLHAWRMT